MSTQISTAQNKIIRFKNLPVVTTAQLAGFYGVDVNNIQQNFKRNINRFVEGKHYFKLTGQDLKDVAADFKSVANFNKVRQLIVWTERGAARHAKMLDTDHAWEVFERLEDCYFKFDDGSLVENKQQVSQEFKPNQQQLYLPKAEGRYFVENKMDGTLIVRQADQYTMIRRTHLDVVKKDCKTIIQELELFSRSLERLESSLELDADLLPILGKLNWRGF